MRQINHILHIASRALAVLAIVAWFLMGTLQASVGVGFICFSGCHARATLISDYLAPAAARWMIPCLALEALALTLFAVYCLAARQPRRAVIPLFILVGGALLGGAGVIALMRLAQSTLPITADGSLILGPAETWVLVGDLAVTLVAVAWSGVLASRVWAAA